MKPKAILALGSRKGRKGLIVLFEAKIAK